MNIESQLINKNLWKKWKYKNTTYLLLSVIAFIFFLEGEFIQFFIRGIGNLGYIGSFISGILFVSVFTIAPASAILFDITKILNPYLVAISAGAGAMLGDYLILRILKDKVFEELMPLFRNMHKSFLGTIFSSPFFTWLIPIIGAFMIASPFPDEIGISLMGLSKIKNWQFLLITFSLNSIGIFLVVILAKSL